MTNQITDTDKVDAQPDMNPLMAAYNPLPPQPEHPARFYWEEPWQDGTSDKAVQAAFEG